jgi:1-deoxy-D-xylulose-5-phosphate reductoisomerase
MAMTATQARTRQQPRCRSVTILGSTGSVGCNTIDLLARRPEAFDIEALTANRNVALLAEQARALRPRMVAIADPALYVDLKEALAGSGIEVGAGSSAIVEAACRPAEWVMASIVGAAGLEPTMAAVRRGAIIGLANKECLVCAGEVMMADIKKFGASLVPVDSEHSAIYQVFDFDNADRVEAIILTASGGPFRCLEAEKMATVTPAQAVAHPNWDMGAKISVDSATMMNKGLELIEAFHLFPVEARQIEIVVHPQSVIHSLVSYVDGSVLAQLGAPDMRTPIAYALAWPDRMQTPAPRLRLAEVGQLTFEAPDERRFPALRLAREALRRRGAAPIVLNAANEIAVESFLAQQIGFLDIPRVVERAMEKAPNGQLNALADVIEIDREARVRARGIIRAFL